MAFESVNVASLKQSINACINSINYNSTNEIITSISNDNVWQTGARDNAKKALNRLVGTNYKQLTDYLNKCLTIVSYIEQYKEEQNKVQSYNSQISTLSAQLASVQSNSQTYIICRGDTLYGISKEYGISMDAIANANGFDSINDTIYTGQTLLIPSSSNVPNMANVSNQIKNLKQKVSQCKTKMSNLESKVSNII